MALGSVGFGTGSFGLGIPTTSATGLAVPTTTMLATTGLAVPTTTGLGRFNYGTGSVGLGNYGTPL